MLPLLSSPHPVSVAARLAQERQSRETEQWGEAETGLRRAAAGLRRASATPTAVLAWHLARLQGTRARRARRTRHAQIASTPAHCGTRHAHRGTCRHGHGVPSRRRKRARPDNDAPQAHLEDFSIVEGPPRLAHLPSHPDATSRSQLSSLASRHGRTQDGGLKTGRNKPEGGFRHETPHSPLKRDASLATQERRFTRHSRPLSAHSISQAAQRLPARQAETISLRFTCSTSTPQWGSV